MKRVRYFTQCERQELQSDWFLLCPEVTNLKLLSNSLSLERSQMIIPKEGTIYPLKAVIILFCELKNVSFEEYINPYQHAILKKDAGQIIKLRLSQVKGCINAHIQNCHQNKHRNSVMFAMFLCQ